MAIPGFEKTYMASTLGRIRSVDRVVQQLSRNGSVYSRNLPGVVLRQNPTPGGYLTIALHRDGEQHSLAVHSIVLLTFLGPRPAGMVGCHDNGDKKDNRLANLRYDTPGGNAADKEKHGTVLWGDTCPSSKLRSHQVIEIRKRTGSHAEVGREFGVDSETIATIRAGKSWRRLLPAEAIL